MRRRALALAILVPALLGGAVRLGALECVFPVRLVGDEYYYVMVAAHLARGDGHVNALGHRAARPPLHPFLLSLFIDGSSPVLALEPGDLAKALDRPGWLEGTPAARGFLAPLLLLQCGLGTLLVAAAAALGAALFEPRTGLAAGLVVALEPTLVGQSQTLWSETLFALLLTSALLGVVLAARSPLSRRPGRGIALGTGALFGAATLTRELALPVAGACALWWTLCAGAAGRREALTRSALMLAVTVAVILPWTFRNAQVLGRVVPVSSIGWFALGLGAPLEDGDWRRPHGPEQEAFTRAYARIRDEGARADFARRYAARAIRAEQPAWLAKKAVRNLSLFFFPDSPLLYKLRMGAYGEAARARIRALEIPAVASYAALMLLAIAGIAAAPPPGRASLACLALGTAAVLHVLSFAVARYRVPWMPLLAVYASWAALHPRAAAAGLRGARLAAALAAALFFLGVCLPYYAEYGGRPFPPAAPAQLPDRAPRPPP